MHWQALLVGLGLRPGMQGSSAWGCSPGRCATGFAGPSPVKRAWAGACVGGAVAGERLVLGCGRPGV